MRKLNWKKTVAVSAALALCVGTLAGCGSSASSSTAASSEAASSTAASEVSSEEAVSYTHLLLPHHAQLVQQGLALRGIIRPMAT